jgi:hypothetical protein
MMSSGATTSRASRGQRALRSLLRVNAPRLVFFNGSNSHVGVLPRSRDASRPSGA